MADVRIPNTLARRLIRYAAAHRRNPAQIVKEAIERQLDAAQWWKTEVGKGIAEADTGKLVPAEKVMRRARALLTRHAGKTATR